jgi:hypothetical protein
MKHLNQDEISGFQGSKDVDIGLLGIKTMWTCM